MNAGDSMVEVYVYENSQLLEQLETMLLDSEKQAELSKAHIDEIFRVMHTIKGSSAMMGYDGLTHLSHGMEDMFATLRQNLSAPKETWEMIFDLVLECIDFFKSEIEKIQQGLLPDGEAAALYDRAVKLNAMVVGEEEKGKAPGVIVMPDDPLGESSEEKAEPEAQKDKSHDTASVRPIPVGGLRYYKAKMFFSQGCSMESVRAFAVINNLDGCYEKIMHEPDNLTVNCDDAIISNGFSIYMATTEDSMDIEARLADTMFLERLEFFEYADLNEVPDELLGEERTVAAVEAASEIVEKEVEADLSKISAPVAANAASEGKPVAAAALETENKETKEQPKDTAGGAQKAAGSGVTQNFLSVNVGKVDKLMDLVGEIVTTESMVTKHPDIVALNLESFDKQSRRLRQLTDELQDVVMSIRMVPISGTFRKMQRIVRDMCRKTGKEAELVLIGEQTEVDKNVIESLSDPLMHMIRNSMDHGIETPEERAAAGKPAVGKITLEARNTGGDVIIMVSDDGQGLDRDTIIRKATEKGLVFKPENEISDHEAYNFILAPGFSTNEEVTEYSGRGVGMDVVYSSIERLGGSVSIDSKKGSGTSFMLNIPLTLAIIDGMDVQVGNEHYIIPILNMRESFEPRLYDLIVEPDGTESILIRGCCYHIHRLHELFMVSDGITDLKQGIMILVESERGSVCLFVDKIVGEQQAVIKPLPQYITQLVGRLPHVSGCTILGNGSISLILDVNSLTAGQNVN